MGRRSRICCDKQADQVLVVDVFLAISERNKAIVSLLQFFAGKRVAELLQTIAKRRAARVFAEYKERAGRTDRAPAS